MVGYEAILSWSKKGKKKINSLVTCYSGYSFSLQKKKKRNQNYFIFSSPVFSGPILPQLTKGKFIGTACCTHID